MTDILKRIEEIEGRAEKAFANYDSALTPMTASQPDDHDAAYVIAGCFLMNSRYDTPFLCKTVRELCDKVPICSICHNPVCDNPKHKPLISNEDWERIKTNIIDSQDEEIADLKTEIAKLKGASNE